MHNGKKIAFVIQRYGKEVNGGAEQYCKQVAEHLNSIYDVEVLTTCAVDYITWANEYSPGMEEINGVKVKRFQVAQKRDIDAFRVVMDRVASNPHHTMEDELYWLKEQGPYCPELIRYIKKNRGKYKVFIFVTYLYHLTYFGLQQIPQKSILVSTAHDEPWAHFDIFYPLFHLPKAMVYLTEEEKSFVTGKFDNDYKVSDIMGIGIDVPTNVQPEMFRNKYGINDEYIVYIGRIDEGKGCHELFEYFIRYKKENPSNLKLVLMGKPAMDIPENQDILTLGFVSEQDKYNGMAGSKILVLPSHFESLSMSVLESLGMRIPVLVSGRSEVLKGHCLRSNAGLYYTNYQEFSMCLNLMLENNPMYNQMGENGEKYISYYYTWDKVIDKYVNLIESITD
jgi:glycosyltransferase involved in cell wall biosynthesis